MRERIRRRAERFENCRMVAFLDPDSVIPRTRIRVRVFAGYDFVESDPYRPQFAKYGYTKGVPMGCDLPPAEADLWMLGIGLALWLRAVIPAIFIGIWAGMILEGGAGAAGVAPRLQRPRRLPGRAPAGQG